MLYKRFLPPLRRSGNCYFHSFSDRREQSKCVLRVLCNCPRLLSGCRLRKGGRGLDKSLSSFKSLLSYTVFFFINLYHVPVSSLKTLRIHSFYTLASSRSYVCENATRALDYILEASCYLFFFFGTRPHLSNELLQIFGLLFFRFPRTCVRAILSRVIISSFDKLKPLQINSLPFFRLLPLNSVLYIAFALNSIRLSRTWHTFAP